MIEEIWLETQGHTNIYMKKWSNPNIQPKAVVQLSHGMVEHINRYNEFADFLVSKGMVVVGNDHRGHGKTGEQQGLFGYFAETDGFEKTTNDLMYISKYIKKKYPNVPLFLLGHSMGSFLARRYIQNYSQMIDGLILSGTGYYPPALAKVGRALASTRPPKEKSNLMNYLTIGNNNRAIKHKKSAFDWLTRDETVIQNYISDPYTGFVPTGRFFYDLMSGLIKIHNPKLNESIRIDLPILLIGGDADPVGQFGSGVFKTAHLLEKAGIDDIITLLFEDGRHEVLNEINRQEVFQVIHKWIVDRLD